MALAATTVWEVNASGSDSNGGGFDTGNANFDATVSIASANTASPVVSTANYTFVAGDVGHWVFLPTGQTHVNGGWYKITAVSLGTATIDATAGNAALANNAGPSTVTGCTDGTTSVTGIKWSIDYSQATSAPIVFTDLVIDGTTNTKCTSTAHPFGKNSIGNIINITGGTGFTVQRVQVSSVTGTTATVDSSLGTLSSTGGTGNLAGALLTPAQAQAIAVPYNQIKLKAKGSTPDYVVNTYISSTHNPNGAVLCLDTGVSLEGYVSVRGDGTLGCVTIQNGVNSAPWVVFVNTIANGVIRFLTLDSNSTSNGQIAFYVNGLAISCIAKKFTNEAFAGNTIFCIADNSAGSRQGTGFSNYFHFGSVAKHTSIGFYQVFGASFVIASDCVNGFVFNSTDSVSNAIAYANTGDGFNVNGDLASGLVNLIAVNNGGYGFNDGGKKTAWVRCFSYNNTSGNLLTSSVVSDVTNLSGTPFTNAAGGDFSLNNTAGAGASCRGILFAFPGISTNAYPDAGAAQHQDSGGGGGSPVKSAYAI